MTDRVRPQDCSTMAEVRHAIDELDAAIVAMFGERFRYIEAAARIKDRRDAVRDEARKSQVIDQASHAARQAGVPGWVISPIYELLVEASIKHELDCFDRHHAVNE